MVEGTMPKPSVYLLSKHGFSGTLEQLANALDECGERNGSTALAICKTAADIIRKIPEEHA